MGSGGCSGGTRVATGGAAENLYMEQTCHLVARVLIAKEARKMRA
jgi:hypothetical protein